MQSEENARFVLKQVYGKLHEKLPLDDKVFCAYLFQYNLLPGNNLDKINVIEGRADKVTHFMSKVVLLDPQIHLPNLLKVMKICDNIAVNYFAKEIETMMGSGRI